jgi:hypothetical protein
VIRQRATSQSPMTIGDMVHTNDSYEVSPLPDTSPVPNYNNSLSPFPFTPMGGSSMGALTPATPNESAVNALLEEHKAKEKERKRIYKEQRKAEKLEKKTKMKEDAKQVKTKKKEEERFLKLKKQEEKRIARMERAMEKERRKQERTKRSRDKESLQNKLSEYTAKRNQLAVELQQWHDDNKEKEAERLMAKAKAKEVKRLQKEKEKSIANKTPPSSPGRKSMVSFTPPVRMTKKTMVQKQKVKKPITEVQKVSKSVLKEKEIVRIGSLLTPMQHTPYFLDLDSGALYWSLPDSIAYASVKMLTHVSNDGSNGEEAAVFYELIDSQETVWDFPARQLKLSKAAMQNWKRMSKIDDREESYQDIIGAPMNVENSVECLMNVDDYFNAVAEAEEQGVPTPQETYYASVEEEQMVTVGFEEVEELVEVEVEVPLIDATKDTQKGSRDEKEAEKDDIPGGSDQHDDDSDSDEDEDTGETPIDSITPQIEECDEKIASIQSDLVAMNVADDNNDDDEDEDDADEDEDEDEEEGRSDNIATLDEASVDSSTSVISDDSDDDDDDDSDDADNVITTSEEKRQKQLLLELQQDESFVVDYTSLSWQKTFNLQINGAWVPIAFEKMLQNELRHIMTLCLHNVNFKEMAQVLAKYNSHALMKRNDTSFTETPGSEMANQNNKVRPGVPLTVSHMEVDVSSLVPTNMKKLVHHAELLGPYTSFWSKDKRKVAIMSLATVHVRLDHALKEASTGLQPLREIIAEMKESTSNEMEMNIATSVLQFYEVRDQLSRSLFSYKIGNDDQDGFLGKFSSSFFFFFFSAM